MALLLPGAPKAQEKPMKTVFEEVDVKDIPSPNGNPWGLVYRGALTRNEPGQVAVHPSPTCLAD